MAEKIIGIRVDERDFQRIEALALSDDRKVSTFVKRVILKQLPILESEAMVLNDSKPLTYPARKRSKKSPK